MTKFPTHSTFKFDPNIHAQKKSTKPTLTRQRQTLSVKQILERFTRGLPVQGGVGTPNYGTSNPDINDPDLEKIKNADLFEKEQFTKAFTEDVKQAKQYEEQSQKAKAQKDAEEHDNKLRKFMEEHAEKLKPKKEAPPEK